MERKDPNILLDGLSGLCNVRGRDFGDDGIPKLLAEFVRSSTGLEGVEGLEDRVGEKKEEVLFFFLLSVIPGGALSGPES